MTTLTTLASGRLLHVEKHDGDDPKAIPIVFIHGVLHTSKLYSPILPYFSNRPRVLFDIQGHGNSPVPDTPSTPSTFAADIKEILEHVGFARADVVGHAGGCTIGIQFAAEFPEKVRRLVLMAPPPLPMPKDGIAKFVSIIRESGAGPMGQWMESCLGNKCKNDSEVRALVASEAAKIEPEGVVSVMDAMKQFEFSGIPQGIETFVVRGTEDVLSDKAACKNMAKLTGGRMVELETGHYFTLEDPRGTGEALKEILE